MDQLEKALEIYHCEEMVRGIYLVMFQIGMVREIFHHAEMDQEMTFVTDL